MARDLYNTMLTINQHSVPAVPRTPWYMRYVILPVFGDAIGYVDFDSKLKISGYTFNDKLYVTKIETFRHIADGHVG